MSDEILPGIGTLPTCPACGAEDVVVDAWAAWNPETGMWALKTSFDAGFCEACETTTMRFVWVRETPDRRARIQALNDALRRGESPDGMVMITPGLRALGPERVAAIRAAVAAFEAFTPANDPHGEHDFGVVEVEGERVFFKIDYLDATREAGSPDPADPLATRRVLTIMLAGEY